MRKIYIFLLLATLSLVYFSCSEKDKTSDRFIYLTDNVWVSDSLLVNGTDASGPGELLEKFVGEANFNKDGTGNFGQYAGGWYFSNDQTNVTITSDDLLLPLTCYIVELTSVSLKITTSLNDPVAGQINIRITFKAK